MDSYILSLLVIGTLLLGVTLGSGWIERLPLSFSLIYLVVGVLLGSYGFGLIEIRPDAEFLQRLSEFVVIVSVFGCGLKMNRPLKLWAWQSTIRLIGLLMPISIFALAAVAHYILGMGWGAAILLGAILAPTDPVLASEVQMGDLEDRDELRFSLTSEGGLNDALAFPFVYFGIYAVKDSNWDNWLKSWIGIDLLWAIASGIVMGIVVAKAVIWIDHHLQKRRSVTDLMEDFVALSIILLTYSLTELVNGYGFLAVFVAGIVVHRSHLVQREKHIAQMEFTEQIEKLLEITAIVILGTVLLFEPMFKYVGQSLLVAALLFLVIRPLGVWLSTLGGGLPKNTRNLMGWFGIKGLGSIYYLTYALGEGVTGETAEQIAWITYTVVVLSIIIYGISAYPLMAWYENVKNKSQKSEKVI
ncbi:sodium:proton antiporter [Pleurocapsa sp. CCALA 161]|uniref:cation:proton antiporter n=1 Tax=Pleurocapsa sp. CCALA 161 TaxID=2107688 RepID=UPI000D05D9D7|nr:sodium:proton antiporter [Pleurocapsa sp. CCALA 161]PSB11907.1 sodium:proton antiporter [Pleurocapsa sp. CCALA 161]